MLRLEILAEFKETRADPTMEAVIDLSLLDIWEWRRRRQELRVATERREMNAKNISR